MIKNRVTELLGIKYPIVQGALGEVSESPKFVAAVCNAGALGILAGVGMGAEGMKDAIREIRELTDQPFGVNLLVANPQYRWQLEVMCQENVPVFAHGRSDPVEAVKSAKDAGLLCIPTIGTAKHAEKAEADGADSVFVTGTEAGGHTGYVGTIVIVPSVVQKVSIPVIAGGGIATPEQFAAVLCLGAEGVMLGTRFMLSKESPLHPKTMSALLAATEEDTFATVHTSGRHQRWLVSPYIRQFMSMPQVKGPDHFNSFLPYAGIGAIEGNLEKGCVGSGQSIGLVDNIMSIAEIVEWMMEGCEKVLKETANFVS